MKTDRVGVPDSDVNPMDQSMIEGWKRGVAWARRAAIPRYEPRRVRAELGVHSRPKVSDAEFRARHGLGPKA